MKSNFHSRELIHFHRFVLNQSIAQDQDKDQEKSADQDAEKPKRRKLAQV
jgi:hypothetical protein